jgi:cellulose synthase operon protein C
VRARDAEAASTAYMHAAVAVEYLERRYGFAKIREALVAFGRGERLGPVLEKLSGESLAALEKGFRDDLTAKLAVFKDQFLPAHTARFARRAALDAPAPKTKAETTPRALAETGLAQLYDGETRAARATLAKALLLHGGREEPTTSFLAAELALAGGEVTSAGDELEALLTRGRDGYDVRVRLALVAVKANDHARAEAHLRKALAFAPTEVEPRLLLVELLERHGRTADRQHEEEALLRIEPQSAALAKRVVLEAAAGGRPAAVAALAPIATFIDPSDADIHAALGRALAASGKPREAKPAFERALRFDSPNPAGVHRALADVLDKLGETQLAARHRQMAASPDGGVSAPSKARPKAALPVVPLAPTPP